MPTVTCPISLAAPRPRSAWRWPPRNLNAGELGAAGDLLDGLAQQIDRKRDFAHDIRRLELAARAAGLAGRFGDALEGLRTVLERCATTLGVESAAIGAALNYAQVLILLNQTETAARLLPEVAASARQRRDAAAAARAALLARLAAVRRRSPADGVPPAASVTEMWRGERAKVAAENGNGVATDDLPDLPQQANFLGFFDDRALAVRWCLAQDALEAAAHRLKAMHEVFGATDSQMIWLRLSVLDGLLAYYAGDPARAEQILAATCPALETLALKPELWLALRVLDWCAARLGRPEEVRRSLIRATESLLEDMTTSMSAADRAIYLLNKWTVSAERIAAEAGDIAALEVRRQQSAWYRQTWLQRQIMRRIDSLTALMDRNRAAAAGLERSGDRSGTMRWVRPRLLQCFHRRERPADRVDQAILTLTGAMQDSG